jgi:hypothetical protein
MCPQAYYAIIRSENHRETLRTRMVRCAEEHSISAFVRACGYGNEK